MTGVAANAAYYETYTTVSDLPNATTGATGITAVQGFAAGSTYLYSIKIDGNPEESNDPANPKAVIWRTHKTTGFTEAMTNTTPTTHTKWNKWLHHANDVALASYGAAGEGQMFVLTGQDGSASAQLVKLTYTGNTYKRTASYNILAPDGAFKSPTGISRVSITDTHVNFLFRDLGDASVGKQVYTGSIAKDALGGADIALTAAYQLDFSHAYLDGVDTPLPGSGCATTAASGWCPQGFFYYDAGNDDIYTTVRNGVSTIVLVFRDVSTSPTTPRASATDLSFMMTPSSGDDRSDYLKHEIEGLALSGGQLFFNTNRHTGTSPNVTPYDGVHRVNVYVAS